MLAIAWEYLLGKAFAATWADRDAPEWPPHPDRVFQALVAAWGETGQDTAGRKALLWLEQQGAPYLAVNAAASCAATSVFVPANDDPELRDLDQLLPGKRHRSKRSFPATVVGGPVLLAWPQAAPGADILDALQDLCAKVTHIGTSRSLVRMWLADEIGVPEPTLVPDVQGDMPMRVPGPGRMAALLQAFAEGGEKWQRPPCASWCRYRKVLEASMPSSEYTVDWVVLKIVSGTKFDLAQSPAVTEALRATLIKGADGMPAAMRLISGHEPDGTPLTVPHLAVVPLGYVGSEHADGHLLGAALVLPRDAGYAERDECLKALLKMTDPDNDCLTLKFGKAGTLTMELDQREPEFRPQTLNPATWCGPSVRWASVTPVVCDRLPSRSVKDYAAWAAEQVALACAHCRLPRPVAVRVSGVSSSRGAPACKPYPPLKSRDGRTPRWHLHVNITFPEAVRGPVLLGAGRYRGYGLCRPLPCTKED